jgi:hypothetical protein
MGGVLRDLETGEKRAPDLENQNNNKTPPPPARRLTGEKARCATAGAEYVPEWNSLVAFKVPRFHEVTAVTSNRPRYSIFGWFLQPGQLYPLHAAGAAAAGAAKRPRKRRESSSDRGTGGKRSKFTTLEELEPGAAAPRCKLARRILAREAKTKAKRQASRLAGDV